MTNAAEISFLREIETMRRNNLLMYNDLRASNANLISARRQNLEYFTTGEGAIHSIVAPRPARTYDQTLRSYASRLPVRPELFDLVELKVRCETVNKKDSLGSIPILLALAFFGLVFGLAMSLPPFPDHQLEMARTLGVLSFVVAGACFLFLIVAVMTSSNAKPSYAPYNEMCQRLGLPGAMIK